MRAFFVLIALLVWNVACVAGEIRAGATMQVKPNSIWFDDLAKFTRWQKLKKSGDSEAFASYQKERLSQRDAWQFIDQLTVKILGYERRNNRVDVEMKTEGRFLGSKWHLEPDALVQ
jgi:hypothetical protein